MFCLKILIFKISLEEQKNVEEMSKYVLDFCETAVGRKGREYKKKKKRNINS